MQLGAAAWAAAALNVDCRNLRSGLWLFDLGCEGNRAGDGHCSRGGETRVPRKGQFQRFVQLACFSAKLTDSLHNELIGIGFGLALWNVQTNHHAIYHLLTVGVGESLGFGLGSTFTLAEGSALTLTSDVDLSVVVCDANCFIAFVEEYTVGDAQHGGSKE